MAQLLSCKLPYDLYMQLEAEAEKYGLSKTDMTKKIFDFYFTRDARQTSLELLLYEIVKNRAVLLRVQDMEGKEFTDALLEESGKDAEAYLTQRKSGKL